MSSSKLSPTELSKNVDDHENEENIDPKSTEGQGVLQEPVVEKEMEARPSPRVLIKPRESWVKKVVSKDSIDSKESISSPEKQIVFPSMTNQNVDNAPKVELGQNADGTPKIESDVKPENNLNVTNGAPDNNINALLVVKNDAAVKRRCCFVFTAATSACAKTSRISRVTSSRIGE